MNVFHAFSGVDSQLMAEKRVFKNINVLGTMEIDIDAIISCGLVHHNERLKEELKKDWNDEKISFVRKWLKERNIGFDFDKGKSKIDRLPKNKLKLLFLSCLLTRNYGDISLANKKRINSEIDLFTYSFPCTDISTAGRQDGLTKNSGTRSSLLWECEKFININKPKFLLLENVKNLVGKKFIKDFENWLLILDKLGYKSYYKVLNAKDYGVPQNRERVFCLSIRKDIDKGYNFPTEIPLEKKLKDLLDDNVDDKYYLKDTAKFFINNSFAMEHKGNGFRFKPHVHNNANIAKCLTTKAGSRMDDNFIIDVESKNETFEFSSKNDELKSVRLFGIFDTEKSKHQAGSVWDKEMLAPTLDTAQGGYRMPLIVGRTDKIITLGNIMPSGHSAGRVIGTNGISSTVMENYGLAITIGDNVDNDFIIRRLTPRECWRLMDFDRDAFNKVKEYISDSQSYKIAGNSIVVSCLEHIFISLKNQYEECD